MCLFIETIRIENVSNEALKDVGVLISANPSFMQGQKLHFDCLQAGEVRLIDVNNLNLMPNHEYLGDLIRDKLIYYPIVSREPFAHQGRLTTLMRSGKLFEDIGLPFMDPQTDRAMLCGGPGMLKDTCAMLNDFGLVVSPKMGQRGDYVIERAFVEQ